MDRSIGFFRSVLAGALLPVSAGCVSLVTKEYQLYEGPRLPAAQVAELVCVLNVVTEVDDRGNQNPETSTLLHASDAQKWGGRYWLPPGRHRVRVTPYASFLGGGYTGLPRMLPPCLLDFQAEAGKRYSITGGVGGMDKTLVGQKVEPQVTITEYVVHEISFWFRIVERDGGREVAACASILRPH